jgi:hypothetical protein
MHKLIEYRSGSLWNRTTASMCASYLVSDISYGLSALGTISETQTIAGKSN